MGTRCMFYPHGRYVIRFICEIGLRLKRLIRESRPSTGGTVKKFIISASAMKARKLWHNENGAIETRYLSVVQYMLPYTVSPA